MTCWTFCFNFLSNRKHRIALNEQTSAWQNVSADVPQGFVLGPILFLIYTNDLLCNFSPKAKLSPDDTSLSTVTHDINASANERNDDLLKISNWAFQWGWVSIPIQVNRLKKSFLLENWIMWQILLWFLIMLTFWNVNLTNSEAGY